MHHVTKCLFYTNLNIVPRSINIIYLHGIIARYKRCSLNKPEVSVASRPHDCLRSPTQNIFNTSDMFFSAPHSDAPQNKMKKLGEDVRALARLLELLESCVGRQKEQLKQLKVRMEACR